MNWKTIIKLIALIIIIAALIFTVFVPFIYYDTGIRCIKAPCPSGANGSILTWLISSHGYYVYYINYLNLVSGIILSFLASCIIALIIINKLKPH